MEKPQLVSSETLFILKTLVEAKVPFMIIGNSAAVLQGAPVVTIDIDLWFGKDGIEQAKKALAPLGVSIVSGFGTSMLPPQFCGPGTEILDIVTTVQGLKSFNRELKNCVAINVGGVDINVLGLARVIKSKKTANRPKDKAVLRQLETALLTISSKS